MLHYYEGQIGKMTIEQENADGKHRYDIQIRQGNALCVMIHVRKATPEELEKSPKGKYIHTLYNFYADEQHIKNIMRDNNGDCMYDKVVKIELNMYFKEAKTLLKYFTRSGHKVTCYYKEDDKQEKGFDWQ